MKNLFLHIGCHKTGTTSIQIACVQNKPILQQQGFDFFNIGAKGNEIRNGNTSSWVSRGEEYYDEIYHGRGEKIMKSKELALELSKSKYDNVIMSAEHFSWMIDTNNISELKRELSEFFNVKIICYIRRQDKLIISHFQQSSSNNDSPSYYYYQGGCLSLPYMRTNYDEYLDYNYRLSKWIDVFGADNVIVKVFEREYLKDGDAIVDFLSIFGIDTDVIKKVNTNESKGFERTKIGHLLNSSKLKNKLEKVIRDGTDNSGRMLPSRRDAYELYQKYRQSNIELNKKLNISEKFEDIFDSDFSNYPESSKDRWTEESANLAITNIFNALSTVDIDIDVDLLRDSAVALESIDLKKSYQLMMIARNARPTGPFINKKIKEYEKALGI